MFRTSPHGRRGVPADSTRRRAPGSVLGLCARAGALPHRARLVRTYQRCLNSARPRRGCYGRVDPRCVQPDVPRALPDARPLLPAEGARLPLHRAAAVRVAGRYEGTVICRSGRRRIDHSYTLLHGTVRSRSGRSGAAGGVGQPARDRDRRHGATSSCAPASIGDPIRESARPFCSTGTATRCARRCFEKRLLRQDGTGFVELQERHAHAGRQRRPGRRRHHAGRDHAWSTPRSTQNLAEEPGGGILSQRRATIIRSVITGNLANDDGGGVYARRGGVQVYDSIVSSNLVDGSGGAIGSTGDILVVRSHVDGNTTDGDGGALYADEDGDVTVIDSTVDGSDADGPGGAIFTLDGDVTIVNSTLNGNRADDRGGAISGEADVTVINSTIARNARGRPRRRRHLGARRPVRRQLDDQRQLRRGRGRRRPRGRDRRLVNSTVIDNIAPVAANIGAGERLDAFGSIIGPAKVDVDGGEAQPTETQLPGRRRRSRSATTSSPTRRAA